MKRILLISFMLVSALITQSWAQDRTVSGRVVDEDGGGLPGVNVVVKGTAQGTVTDIDGNYKLSVPADGGTLVFSFIGLQTQEQAIGNKSVIDVTLSSDVTQLTEVVVTAAGIEREKKALGYSVTNISSDAIAQKSEPDPIRSLNGKIAGVNIVGASGGAGSATNINIRGRSSLTGSNQPLFVVDGVPFFSGVSETTGFASGASTYTSRSFDIDPNNIESMTVLKGAAASALYGSRAAGGVIVITTKGNNRTGAKNGLEVAVSSSYSVEEVANIIEVQDQYTQGAEFSYNGAFVGSWGARYDGLGQVAHPLDQGRLNDAFPEFIGQQITLSPRNNAEEFFRTGNVLENSLQIRSTSDKTTLTAGVTRTDQEGIVPFNEITRTSINFGGNAQLQNGLFVSGNINYVNVDQTGPQIGTPLSGNSTSILERLLFTPPNYDLANYPYINPLDNSSVYYRTDQDNPYWLAETSPYTSQVDRYFGNFTLTYDITEWLSATYRAGFNAFTDRRKNVIAPSSVANVNGEIVEDYIFQEELDGTFLLTLNKDLNEDFNVRVILGHNINQRTSNRQLFQGVGIIVFGLNDLDLTTTQTNFGGGFSRRRLIGAFVDATLSYRDWAFLNLVGRNDWSSTLPQGNNSFAYPGASASVILTDALQLQSNVLTYAKIRAGISKVGNDALPYQLTNVFSTNGFTATTDGIGTPFGGTLNVLSESNGIGDPQLNPEFTTEYEIGTDLQFFNNRIGVDFTYYYRSSTDQIVPISRAPSSGVLSFTTNIGEVTNEGIEVGLNVTPVQLDNGFRWDINTVFTKNENIVQKLDDAGELDQIIIGGFSNLGIVHRPGLPYGQILADDFARDAETGLPLINPESGLMIGDPELRIVGDPNPNFTLGVTNTFSFKGISLSFLIDYKDGGDLYSFSTAQTLGRGIAKATEDREWSRVIPGILADPGTLEPILDENGNKIENNIQITSNEFHFIDGIGSAGATSHNVYDASVVRLREVSLGYTLPTSLLSKTPFGSASISLTGRNLWYSAPNFPEGMNIDPEISSLNGNSLGLDFSTIPTTKRYGVNLRFTF